MTAAKLGRLGGRLLWVVAIVAGLLVLALPWLGVSSTTSRQVVLVAVLALSASGLCLAWGFGGELAVGQAAIYAAGAYTTGILVLRGWDWSLALVASVLVAVLLGFVTGLPSMRVSGWGVAMMSFFLILLVPDVLNLPALKKHTGGVDGLAGLPAPVLFGRQLSREEFYAVVIILLFVWLAAFRNFVVSRHGSALRVMRESPELARSLGLSVARLKLTAYVMGALPAGIAGSAFVYVNRFLGPESFSFDVAVQIIAAAVIGTLETVFGAIFGAAVLIFGSSYVLAFDRYSSVLYGVYMVVGGVLLTRPRVRTALANLRRRFREWRVGGAAPTAAAPIGEFPPLPGGDLKVDGVSKSFGGVAALKSVSIEAKPGQITALIGANGSGKTTLLNVISGYYRPDEGSVLMNGAALHGSGPAQTARRGVGRTFQTPIMPQSISTLEAVEVARFQKDYVGILATILRLPRYRRVARSDAEEAVDWLSMVGVADTANALASSLPLGSRRLVEVARALATGASVLLLDETASGLDADDIDRLGTLLRRLRDAGVTIVLVEHNFGLVCDLADSIYVLDRGELIAQGDADHIRSSPAVARSYLGQVAATTGGGSVDEPTGEEMS